MVNDQEEEMDEGNTILKDANKKLQSAIKNKTVEKCQLLRLWSKLQKQEVTVQGKS